MHFQGLGFEALHLSSIFLLCILYSGLHFSHCQHFRACFVNTPFSFGHIALIWYSSVCPYSKVISFDYEIVPGTEL